MSTEAKLATLVGTDPADVAPALVTVAAKQASARPAAAGDRFPIG